MRAHGHRDPDRAQHHGHQANQAEQSGGSFQAVCKRRIAFPEVSDLGVRQHLLQACAHGGDTSTVTRQLEEEALSRAAPLLQQAALFKGALGHHHARAQAHARAHTVRLAHQDGRDAKRVVADLQARADLGVQPYEQVFGNHDSSIGEHLAQISRGLENDGTIEGILLRIDGLERNQQRHGIAGRRDHRHQIADFRTLDTAGGQRIELLLLLLCRLAEHARGEIGGHDGARLPQQGLLKRVAKAAHAGKRGNPNRHRQDYK